MKEEKKRYTKLLERLSAASSGHDSWTLNSSEPSGSSPNDNAKEVHLCLTKNLIATQINFQTLHKLPLSSPNNMCHAPFVCLLEPTDLSMPRIVMTSVHLPPKGKKSRERDIQIKRILESYSSQSDVRLKTPFTEKGARDANQRRSTVHVIAGDWNAWVGDPEYNANKHGFDVLLGKNTMTSAGRQPYDNFVVSQNYKEHCTIGAAYVKRLKRPQNSALGQIGLSDHSPIYLELDFTSQQQEEEMMRGRGKTERTGTGSSHKSKFLSP